MILRFALSKVKLSPSVSCLYGCGNLDRRRNNTDIYSFLEKMYIKQKLFAAKAAEQMLKESTGLKNMLKKDKPYDLIPANLLDPKAVPFEIQ